MFHIAIKTTYDNMAKQKNLLETEIRRFNQILSYQDKMSIDEGPYRFYNDMREAEDEELQDQGVDMGGEAPQDPMGGDMPQDPMGGDMPQDPMGGEAPQDPMGGDMPQDPMGGDMPQDPMGGDMPQDPMGDETIELDITDLVQKTEDVKLSIQTSMQKFDDVTNKINGIMGKVDSLEDSVAKMDTVIKTLDSLATQVSLMRPPTEAERRKALAKDSYPFSVTMDQYNAGTPIKTQTDLEQNSKISMLNSLFGDYDEQTIKDTF